MIVFVGPSPKPITGQSLAFDIISGYYNKDKKVFYYGVSSQNLLLISWGTLCVFFSFFWFLITHRSIKTLYLTTSRTTLGFCRDLLFVLTAKLFSIKVVNHLHGADFKDFRSRKRPWFRKFVDYVYEQIDTSIVLLPRMKDQYDIYRQMNVVSISNCALPISDLPRKRTDYLKVLYLSNIMYSKGIFLLIEAVDSLIKSGAKVQLSIAGEPMGDEYKDKDDVQIEFERAIRNKPYVEYMGTVTGTKKDQLLIDSDVFVLPSFYKTEAQPISIIEAMLAGSAIITTNHNYLADMVTSNIGCVIGTRSTKEIELSLLSLIDHPDKLNQVCRYNKSYAKKYYSLERYVKDISIVLETHPDI
ncbi:glycosyltransferase family 4 protein [Vibrio sp. A1-1]|uniref:glycosyltransferase family 4 protein n=1 Tax=Vibrio sp. A1-1 TaxID=2912250 RepID=UPI001F37EDA7|nr:glycosyltransferase family 4 protein [Vibrio sp. A1-1]MCF7455155.1 glycosyltransferase family 4 protein [Vibrio sp. A1-1]